MGSKESASLTKMYQNLLLTLAITRLEVMRSITSGRGSSLWLSNFEHFIRARALSSIEKLRLNIKYSSSGSIHP